MEMKPNYFILVTTIFTFHFYAQKSDYVVTNSLDTIYVDDISVTDFKVKTKTANKKKQYAIEDIQSYFIVEDQKHFERIENTIEKKVPTKIDKYDYRQLENAHIQEYENRIKYKFMQRLTLGKIKLFVEEIYHPGTTPGLGKASFAPKTEKKYFLAIYDLKLEPVNYVGNNSFWKITIDLTLTKDVYELLKIYLTGNNAIVSKLEQLYLIKPIADEKQIIDLINEYNESVK